MEPLSAMIIDNELEARKDLAHLCNSMIPNVNVQETLGYDEFFGLKKKESVPRLVFFDLGGKSRRGSKLLKNYQSLLPPYVIFTDSIDCFPGPDCLIKPIACLDKPVNHHQLYNAVQRIIEKDMLNSLKRQLNTLSERIIHLCNPPIELPTTKGFELVRSEEVVYLESDNNYTLVVLNNGKRLLISKTLKVFENSLSPHCFLRIHKRFIVNLKYVVRYLKGDGGEVVLKGGQTLSVARNRKEELINRLRSLY